MGLIPVINVSRKGLFDQERRYTKGKHRIILSKNKVNIALQMNMSTYILTFN